MNGVSHSEITHCAVLISLSIMIARKYRYRFWYCIRNNLAISKYSISNPNQRLSHNSGQHPTAHWVKTNITFGSHMLRVGRKGVMSALFRSRKVMMDHSYGKEEIGMFNKDDETLSMSNPHSFSNF